MAAGARKKFGVFLLLLGTCCFAVVVPIMDQLISTSFVRHQGFTSSMSIMVGVAIAGLILVLYGLFLFRGPRRK